MHINELKKAENFFSQIKICKESSRFYLRYVLKNVIKWFQNQPLGYVPKTKCSLKEGRDVFKMLFSESHLFYSVHSKKVQRKGRG